MHSQYDPCFPLPSFSKPLPYKHHHKGEVLEQKTLQLKNHNRHAMDYETYEAKCKKIRVANQILLDAFQESLKAKKLSQKTIDKHVFNIDFYINDYLLYEDAEPPEDGVTRVNYFFSCWFFRKAMWASATSIKENITSLKKFYGFMEKKGRLEPGEYLDMLQEMKESKEEWLEILREYDEGNASSNFW